MASYEISDNKNLIHFEKVHSQHFSCAALSLDGKVNYFLECQVNIILCSQTPHNLLSEMGGGGTATPPAGPWRRPREAFQALCLKPGPEKMLSTCQCQPMSREETSHAENTHRQTLEATCIEKPVSNQICLPSMKHKLGKATHKKINSFSQTLVGHIAILSHSIHQNYFLLAENVHTHMAKHY